MRTTRHRSLLFGCGWVFLVLGTDYFNLQLVSARIACNSSLVCETLTFKGSECWNGYCSNPFYKHGCLANMLPSNSSAQRQRYIRTCNSEDPPEALEQGYCRLSSLDYMEVRILGQNWESAFFVSWILQILLSEILEVPVSIETGVHGKFVNFYHPESAMDYGTSNDWTALKTADRVKDCRTISDSVENYTSCAHFVTEVWSANRQADITQLHAEGFIEPLAGLGALGDQGWYVPKHIAKQDTSLLTYLGLEGEENRRKLAETFLRPTTWNDYCQEESANNCSTPDTVATRAPVSAEENLMYFLDGVFTGYFRKTAENDCDAWPDNCTGHIVDFPCGWYSLTRQQTHHLNIALASSGNEPITRGYSYGQMVQIWSAANATKAAVMLTWWSPEALYTQNIRTDMEFTRVSLPPPTQECVDHQIKPDDRCNLDPAVQVGDARGACDVQPQVLAKVLGNSLYDISNPRGVDKDLQSPAYEAVRNLQISELNYGQMLEAWLKRGIDPWNYDARDAVCEWVVDNMDLVNSFVPRSHPRVIVDKENVYQTPLNAAAVAVAGLAVLLTCVSSWIAYVQRSTRAIRYGQIEFLGLLLTGLLILSLGSLIIVVPLTNARCVSIIWLINLGYGLELVPLIVKVAAIHKIFTAAQHMRRVQVRKRSLFGTVSCILFLVIIGLTIWTVMDPPQKKFQLELTDSIMDDEFAVIEKTYYCGQDMEFWNLLEVSWQVLLLLCASVMAFRTRKVQEDFNEARTLAMLVYSHFVLAVCRAITYIVNANKPELAASRSLIYSVDVIATLFIYFFPKFLKATAQTALILEKRESPPPGGLGPWHSSAVQRVVLSLVPQSIHDEEVAEADGIGMPSSSCNPNSSQFSVGSLSSELQRDLEVQTRNLTPVREVSQVLEEETNAHNERTEEFTPTDESSDGDR